MIRLFRSRRRVAALASTALATGALAVLPVGISPASAAPVSVGVTCTISGSFPQTLDQSTFAATVTAPANVDAGETFTAHVDYTLNEVNANYGPVDNVSGDLDLVLSVGGVESTVSLPTSTWTSGDKIYTGAGDVTLTAPERVDAVDISVVSATLDGTAHVNAGPPGGVTQNFDVPCTPNAGQKTALASTTTQANLDYTCVMTPPGSTPPSNLASTLTIGMSVPDAVTAGESFETTVTATLDMGEVYFGPVSQISGSLDIDLLVGDRTTTVVVPITTRPVTGSAADPDPQVVTGSKTVVVQAPAGAAEDADLAVGDVLGNYSMLVFGTANPTQIPCTADDGPTVTLNELDVEAAPAGAKYSCTYGSWTFPAYLATTATLPGSVKEDDVLNPALTTTLTWGRYWADSSRNIEALYQNGTATLATSTSGKAGSGSLGFTSTPVPATGAMVWTATGSYGAVDTTKAGTAALSFGDLSLKVQTDNKFTPGFTPATIACTLLAGQSTALGSVTIEDVPDIAATGAQVTGSRKVGEPLTASATLAPADAAVAYVWMRNGAPIAGATTSSYTPVAGDLGTTISVQMSATKAGYDPASATATAGTVVAGTFVVTGTSKIKGTPKVNKLLTVAPGTAAGTTVTYQWLVNGKPVAKATAASMKVTKALAGKKVSVKVTYAKAGYASVVQTTKAVKVAKVKKAKKGKKK